MRRSVLFLTFVLAIALFSGCGNTNQQSNTNQTSVNQNPNDNSASTETKNSNTLSFVAVSDDVLKKTLPAQALDTSLISTPVVNALNSIGTSSKEGTVIGNLEEDHNGIDTYNMDIKTTTTEGKTVLVGLMYIDLPSKNSKKEWTVTSIADFNTGHCYYVPAGSEGLVDLYDYKTGKLVSKASKSTDDILNDYYNEMDKIQKDSEKQLDEIKKKYNVN